MLKCIVHLWRCDGEEVDAVTVTDGHALCAVCLKAFWRRDEPGSDWRNPDWHP
jgi:hypothetical protein